MKSFNSVTPYIKFINILYEDMYFCCTKRCRKKWVRALVARPYTKEPYIYLYGNGTKNNFWHSFIELNWIESYIILVQNTYVQCTNMIFVVIQESLVMLKYKRILKWLLTGKSECWGKHKKNGKDISGKTTKNSNSK